MVMLIKTSEKEIMLDINLDSKLKYKDHVNFMCKKINQKLYVLDRIAPLMDVKRRSFTAEGSEDSEDSDYSLFK